MKITKIEVQKKNKERVSVFVDDEYSFSLHAEIIYKFGIKVGTEITPDFMETVGKVEEQKKANNYAMTLISKAFKTEKQIVDKMKQKDFEQEYIDKAISMLKEYKYIDDTLFAQSYVSDSVNFTKMGKNKIKNKLYQKGVDKDTINDTLNSLVNDDQQFEAALEIAKKKYRTIRETDKRKKNQKMTSFLQYRGFSFDIIKKVLNELNNDFFEDEY